MAVPRTRIPAPAATPEPAAPHAGPGRGPASRPPVVFLSLRDLANPQAGGSEQLVDRLASGLVERGYPVTLVCGGPVDRDRPYRVVRNGSRLSQFVTAPRAVHRLGRVGLLVEVCNGMPFLTPLWCNRPRICLVNHVHSELWQLRYPPPVAALGRYAETVLMPRAHRRNLFVAVSESTASALADLGVDRDRIRIINNGVEDAEGAGAIPLESPEPMFLALGRLAEYKRIDLLLRLWERVRPVTGGTLVIAGDGPERERLQDLAGPGVRFTGKVSERDKAQLLSSAWLLLHPAQVEGWGLVVTEAAIRHTPAIGFDVPGLRDSVLPGVTGLLARTESGFASAWATLALDPRRRRAMGRAARLRGSELRWPMTVDRFAAVVDEALHRDGAGRGSGSGRG